jgi:hypothetical protein
MAVGVAGAHFAQRRSEDAIRVDSHHLAVTARADGASRDRRAGCGVS